MHFKLASKFKPSGDQPQAIQKLTEGILAGQKYQTLLGVTGSGKTFTMAGVIENVQKPVLVISPNKTLAAQLWQEFKEFFPQNAVHYFVSYYDYYQPEAYIPQTDTYIGKDAKINEEIDRLRYGATQALISRDDVIIVASVSCIYGIGDPAEYEKISFEINGRMKITELAKALVLLQYRRNNIDPRPGEFKIRGDQAEIRQPSGDETIKIEFKNNRVEKITRSVTGGDKIRQPANGTAKKIYPAKHFVAPRQTLLLALENIKSELKERIDYFKKTGKLLEAERLTSRTNYDLEMLKQTGYSPGIENYSRHLSFRQPGEPPYTLIDYYRYRFGGEFIVFIDESHIAIPQICGMFQGDRARKQTLVEFGFRLPSAIDNRPLKSSEFESKIAKTVYVSATPGELEIKKSKNGGTVTEQLIRPTGLLDPKIEVRPAKTQIPDLIKEIKNCAAKKERVLVTTLTKRMAEDLADYLEEQNIKTHYLHSEIKTMERPSRLHDLRTGKVDVLVGINLLREGLDLPEVALVAILDADKEGFLRNETTLIQTMGRASRHINGRVIMYADTLTYSMEKAIKETERRRKIQQKFNREHGITPQGIKKEIRPVFSARGETSPFWGGKNPTIKNFQSLAVEDLVKEMKIAAKNLDFEKAAKLRDLIKKFKPC